VQQHSHIVCNYRVSFNAKGNGSIEPEPAEAPCLAGASEVGLATLCSWSGIVVASQPLGSSSGGICGSLKLAKARGRSGTNVDNIASPASTDALQAPANVNE